MRPHLAAAAFALSLTAAGAAWAQVPPEPPEPPDQPVPPAQVSLDPRGVDLVSGALAYATTEVVIGRPGAGGIAYGRVFVGGGRAWRDSLLGTINLDPSSGDATVSVGGESETFTNGLGGYEPQSGDGSTLTESSGTWTFTSSSGAVAHFSAPAYINPRMPYQADALLNDFTTPSGEALSYHYVTASYCLHWNSGHTACLPGQGGVAIRLQSVTNNRGYQIHYTYGWDDAYADLNGWLTVKTVTGYNNGVFACAPDAATCSDTTRTWPHVTYEIVANPTTVTDELSRVTTYGYSTSGNLTSVRAPGSTSNDLAITYDSTSGRVSGVTDASGAWSYSYTISGTNQTTTVSGPASQSLTAAIDLTTGTVSSLTDALSHTTAYQYDANRRVTRITRPQGDASGGYTTFTYDTRGNLTQTRAVAQSGSGLADIVTSATYPSSCSNPVTCNRPTSTTDALGNQTDYTWNTTHGGLETVTLPAPTTSAVRPQTRIAYDSFTAWYWNAAGTARVQGSAITLPVATSACATGTDPTCLGTADESRTTLAYESGSSSQSSNLLPTTVTARSGNTSGTGAVSATTTTTWTADGDPETVDGPLSGSTDLVQYRYDAGRQLIGVIGPDPDGSGALHNRAQRLTYNARGQVTLTEAGTTAGYTDTDWAAFATLQRQATTYETAAFGRPLTGQSQAADGTPYALAQLSYDAAGRVACQALRMNPAAYGALPPSACMPQTVSGYGADRITAVAYDDVGRVATTTTAYGTAYARAETLTYTADGLPETLADANGNLSTLVYDGHDRLSRLRYPNATGGGSSTTDYEEWGYPTSSSHASTYRNRANTTYTTSLDNLSRAVSRSGGADSLSFAYDNLNRPLSVSRTSTPTGSVTWTWDALSRRLTETDSALGTLTSAYDDAGRRTRLTWPDAVHADYGWDLYGGLLTVGYNGGSTPIAAYAYDDLGRLTAITRSNGAGTAYAYDPVSRLASIAQNPTGSTADVTLFYSRNPAGQIVTRALTNSAYDYSPTGTSDAYAFNGRNQFTAAAGTTPTYSSRGDLTAAAGQTFGYDLDGRLTSAGSATFAYDPLGRFSADGGSGTRFQYDGWELVGEYPSSGSTLSARHIPGAGLDDTVATYTSSGATWWLRDERNSTIAQTDTSGAAVAINTYDEYGLPAATNGGRFQYAGRVRLPGATGLYDYRTRAYSADLGRFLQPDSIGYDAGLNLYAYVGGDPVNMTDPMGTNVCWYTKYPGPTPAQDTSTFNGCFPEYEDMFGRRPFSYGEGGGSGDSASVGNATTELAVHNCRVAARQLTPRQIAGAAGSAAGIFGNFLSGAGPESRTYGPDSPESTLLSYSPGVLAAIDAYNAGRDIPRFDFHNIHGALAAGANPTRQLVGSFRASFTGSGDQTRMTVYNGTNVFGLTYHFPGVDVPFFGHLGFQNISRQGSMLGDALGTVRQRFEIPIRCTS